MKILNKKITSNGRRHIYFLGIKIASYRPQKQTTIINYTNFMKYISNDKIELFLQENFYKKTGKLPTETLETFNEKLLYMAMFENDDLKTKCADKIAVREYVSSCIGDKYLPVAYDVLENGEQFSPEKYPSNFVLSFNAGSGENIIVTEKNELDIAQIRQQINNWIVFHNHSYSACEMQYYNIMPRVIVREYIDMKTDLEYKLFCFMGQVEFIQVISYKHGHSNIGTCHYDRNWKRLPFWRADKGLYELTDNVPKPQNLDELIFLSEKLAKPFKFARIDFYETVSGNLKFGEITFTPTAANIVFGPDNDYWQKYWGDKIIL